MLSAGQEGSHRTATSYHRATADVRRLLLGLVVVASASSLAIPRPAADARPWRGGDHEPTTATSPRTGTVGAPCNIPRIVLGAGKGALVAVAAAAPHDLWAVGSTAAGRPLIEHGDGVRWTVVGGAPGVQDAALAAVAALGPADVWAVGARARRPFVEHWDGRRWTAMPGPAVEGTLSAVAGVSSRDVWVAGHHMTDTLFAHWDGRRWAIVDRISGVSGSGYAGTVTSLSLVSSRDGWAANGGMERLRGASWDIVDDSLLGTAYSFSFTGGGIAAVAARSSRDAWAVGAIVGDAIADPVALRWDGTLWNPTATPRVNEGLDAVAATPGRDVWAAGRSLLLRWDGRRWQEVPSPPGGVTSFAVAGPQDLWAVGGAARAGVPLLTHIAGSACARALARVQALPLPGNLGGLQQTTSMDSPIDPTLMVVDASDNRAFVADGPSVDIFDLRRRHLLRAVAVGDARSLALDGPHHRVYIATGAAQASIAVLDARSGARLRSLAGGSHLRALALDARTARLFVINGAAPGAPGRLRVLDTATGAVVRATPITDATGLAVDEAARRAIVLAGRAARLIDATSGRPLAPTPLALADGPNIPPPALAIDDRHGLAVVGAGTGVTVIDTRTGRAVRTLPLGAPPTTVRAVAIDRARGRLLVLTADRLVTFDTVTGTQLLDLGVDGDASTLLVNERTGRVYVSCAISHNQYGDASDRGDVLTVDETTGLLLSRTTLGSDPAVAAIDPLSEGVFVFWDADQHYELGNSQAQLSLLTDTTPSP